MQIKMFYRTQRDLAVALNILIDAYWNEEILEKELIEKVKEIHRTNQEKLIKNDDFTKVVQQHCGKRRLSVVEKIIEMK